MFPDHSTKKRYILILQKSQDNAIELYLYQIISKDFIVIIIMMMKRILPALMGYHLPFRTVAFIRMPFAYQCGSMMLQPLRQGSIYSTSLTTRCIATFCSGKHEDPSEDPKRLSSKIIKFYNDDFKKLLNKINAVILQGWILASGLLSKILKTIYKYLHSLVMKIVHFFQELNIAKKYIRNDIWQNIKKGYTILWKLLNKEQPKGKQNVSESESKQNQKSTSALFKMLQMVFEFLKANQGVPTSIIRYTLFKKKGENLESIIKARRDKNREKYQQKPDQQSNKKQKRKRSKSMPNQGPRKYDDGHREEKAINMKGIYAFIATIITALFTNELDNGLFWIWLNEFKKREAKNFKASIGEKVIVHGSKDNHKFVNNISEFQVDTDQEEAIKKLYEFGDHKVIQFMECHIGNGFSTNLIRFLADKKKEISNRKSDKEGEGEGEGKKKKKKEKDIEVIYYDFKQPQSDQIYDESWGIAEELHNLMTKLINDHRKVKKSADLEKYLIINEIQMLESCFNSGKDEQSKLKHEISNKKMNELFKQIIYLQKQSVAKVIILSNAHYFFDDYVSHLPCVDIQDYKRATIQQLEDKDIKKVIKARMGYQEIQKTLNHYYPDEYHGKYYITKLQKAIKQIINNTNSSRECMKSFKKTKLDNKYKYYSFQEIKKAFHLYFPDESYRRDYLKKLEEIIEQMVKNTNSSRECMRILKEIKLDHKEKYTKFEDKIDDMKQQLTRLHKQYSQLCIQDIINTMQTYFIRQMNCEKDEEEEEKQERIDEKKNNKKIQKEKDIEKQIQKLAKQLQDENRSRKAYKSKQKDNQKKNYLLNLYFHKELSDDSVEKQEPIQSQQQRKKIKQKKQEKKKLALNNLQKIKQDTTKKCNELKEKNMKLILESIGTNIYNHSQNDEKRLNLVQGYKKKLLNDIFDGKYNGKKVQLKKEEPEKQLNQEEKDEELEKERKKAAQLAGKYNGQKVQLKKEEPEKLRTQEEKDEERKMAAQLAQQKFYLDYHEAKLQALRDLNKANVLHGFEFVSKSMKKAFEEAKLRNPDLEWVEVKLNQKQGKAAEDSQIKMIPL